MVGYEAQGCAPCPGAQSEGRQEGAKPALGAAEGAQLGLVWTTVPPSRHGDVGCPQVKPGLSSAVQQGGGAWRWMISHFMLKCAPRGFGLSPSPEVPARCGDLNLVAERIKLMAAEHTQLIPLMHDTRGTGGKRAIDALSALLI